MGMNKVLARARRGLREDFRLYTVAIGGLTVAFLCLGAVLLAIANLSHVGARWTESGRMSVYLREGAPAAEARKLQAALEGTVETASVTFVTSAQARDHFLQSFDMSGEFAALPPDVFPASLEVVMSENASVSSLESLALRVREFGIVDEVETYRGWFDQIAAVVTTARGAAALFGLLVVVCVLVVVGSTIRLAVANRRGEIEVMKLCGATDWFVRGPFVVEGALQGCVAAALSVAVLVAAFLLLRTEIDPLMVSVAGTTTRFLHPASVVALIAMGTAAGAGGSLLSLKRYLAI